MRTDDNWKETRVLAEDLNTLLNLPNNISEEYFKVLENLIVHKFLEKLLEDEDNNGKDYSIELPYIGTIVVSVENDRLSTSFSVKSSFYKKIKSAYDTKESPLVKQCSDILGEVLSRKFLEGADSSEIGE